MIASTVNYVDKVTVSYTVWMENVIVVQELALQYTIPVAYHLAT